MELAENMYNKALEQEKWRMQTDEQKRILALTAKVEGLECATCHRGGRLRNASSWPASAESRH